MTSALDGVVRDGRHHMQIRVYYEDTDFGGTVYYKVAALLGGRFIGPVDGIGPTRSLLQMGMGPA